MLSHFSANQQAVSAMISSSCRDPQGCMAWVSNIEAHMQAVLPQAEERFTSFLLYARNQIICPREYERVVDEVDQLGLRWSEFAYAVRGGYIIEWYDTQDLPELALPLHNKQHRERRPQTYMITLKQGHQSRGLRPKSVLDMAERAEYCGSICRYQMTLRCDALRGAQAVPLIVECQYNEQPTADNTDWILHITGVLDPRSEAEKWNADYTQRVCNCAGAERTASYDWTFRHGELPTRRHV